MEDDKEEHWALSHVQIGDQQRQPFTRRVSQKGGLSQGGLSEGVLPYVYECLYGPQQICMCEHSK